MHGPDGHPGDSSLWHDSGDKILGTGTMMCALLTMCYAYSTGERGRDVGLALLINVMWDCTQSVK